MSAAHIRYVPLAGVMSHYLVTRRSGRASAGPATGQRPIPNVWSCFFFEDDASTSSTASHSSQCRLFGVRDPEGTAMPDRIRCGLLHPGRICIYCTAPTPSLSEMPDVTDEPLFRMLSELWKSRWRLAESDWAPGQPACGSSTSVPGMMNAD